MQKARAKEAPRGPARWQDRSRGSQGSGGETVQAEVLDRTEAETLQGFVTDYTCPATQVYTGEAKAYDGLPRAHETVRHRVSEYVRTGPHERHLVLWALLKRGYHGTYRHMSRKHLERYVIEFEGRHSSCPMDTEWQMAPMARSVVGKRSSARPHDRQDPGAPFGRAVWPYASLPSGKGDPRSRPMRTGGPKRRRRSLVRRPVSITCVARVRFPTSPPSLDLRVSQSPPLSL